MLGWQDAMVLMGVGMALFGVQRLPDLARSLGQSVAQFKKGLEGEPDPPEPKPEAKE